MEPVELEKAGWQALSESAEAATAFYDEVLAADVEMLLPGGMRIADRGQALDAMSGAPWESFDLSETTDNRLADDVTAVTYRARAVRGGATYEALINSTYVRRYGKWKLALHQQTPI